MRMRWFRPGRARAVLEPLIQFGSLFTGPLPGIHYPDPGPDEPSPRSADGADGRPQGPPAGHPERPCTTPPTPMERRLWADLGIDEDVTRH
ncbi:DUF6059 family protein [Streptomyces chromofuscus]|uniref:Uncharacterized protein n=1 Tax=Streptomyces chromofuscus TaxID=42881 RepID=A0A7M2T508_STRCW|nr:DUF6059 family protein [Streptomyces chromofuscus]QOV43767.1 hypothetical protein IPT68_29390 [Streptomyces chromofuscus]GGT22096.1 hypothetical protein GCM10010254_48360 [Streptomyces chromofuscus]